MSNGMSSAPSAMPATSVLSTAPNTRPITSSGTMRCRIVNALTSTSELPTPMRTIAPIAAARVGHAARMTSGAAQSRTPMPKSNEMRLRAREHERREPPDDATDADHRAEVTDARLAEVEHLQRDRNPEDEARAGDDRLCEEERHQETQVAVGEDRAEACGRLGDEALRLFLLLADVVLAAEPHDQRGRPHERHRVDKDHGLLVRDRQQQPGERGTGEEPDALDGARRDVGGGELRRILRE